MRRRILGTMLLCLALSMAVAGPLEEGLSAYERGDYASALRILRPLAEQGIASAQSMLGVMYGNGDGVSRDFAEARRWFQKAADQGHADAQDNLAAMYFKGDGLIQDYVQAHKWLSLSAAGASTDKDRARRTEIIRLLAAKMTPAQISEARKLANECKALGTCPAVPATVPGKTVASPVLQGDIFRFILTIDSGPECNERKIVNIEILIAPESSNSFTGIERWTLDRCGQPVPYRVMMSPSPRGGTDFNVARE